MTDEEEKLLQQYKDSLDQNGNPKNAGYSPYTLGGTAAVVGVGAAGVTAYLGSGSSTDDINDKGKDKKVRKPDEVITE